MIIFHYQPNQRLRCRIAIACATPAKAVAGLRRNLNIGSLRDLISILVLCVSFFVFVVS
jgi:hypothetical protein